MEDKKVVPMRGQLVVVGNDSRGMWGLSGADDMNIDIGESCYIIPRPAGAYNPVVYEKEEFTQC